MDSRTRGEHLHAFGRGGSLRVPRVERTACMTNRRGWQLRCGPTTDDCMRKAISYCAIRARVSELPIFSCWICFSSPSPSSILRRSYQVFDENASVITFSNRRQPFWHIEEAPVIWAH